MTHREQIPSVEGSGAPERPRLIFSTELIGEALQALLETPRLLATLVAQGHGLALTLARLDDATAAAVRLLNQQGVAVIGGLCLPAEEGFAFNLQNYPQAMSCYRAFHAWARGHGLRFEAVGLSIEPPLADVGEERQRGLRALLRRFWLARENILYPAAHAAYSELIVAIHLDGYEVHTYQMAVIADDRRAGSTLIQRALDIVDLPSDLDVLMCSSAVPIDLLGNDLGGALVASYGANADAIGIGSIGEGDPDGAERDRLPWPALRRDLLLAAQHTDTIYVYALEDVVARDLLSKTAGLDWSSAARARPGRRLLIGLLRSLLFVALLAGPFARVALAWGGWALAITLWLRGRRRRAQG